jgi:hypothetical protein
LRKHGRAHGLLLIAATSAACASGNVIGPPDDSPTALALLTPPPATAQTGAPFPAQPVVQALNASGEAVAAAGITVAASLASSPAGAALSGTTTLTTSADGRAAFTNLALTGPAGMYTLRFGAPNLTAVSSQNIRLLPENPFIPLTDLAPFRYFGFAGGLYPGGSNVPPSRHDSVGRERARRIQPRDATGAPSPSGKYVLMSIGMSNTTQEWCAKLTPTDPGVAGGPCNPWSFTGQAAADPAVNRATLVIANGALGSQAADAWDAPAEPNYNRVRDDVLAPQALTEQQVQVLWIKVAHIAPGVNGPGNGSMPAAGSDADSLMARMASIVRAAKVRYPNLAIVFLSSRIYAGYATIQLNPEPYAFESGFSVKWLIEAQIAQMANGGVSVDPRAGNLNYDTVAPWLAWGAYLWGNGLTPRGDGLVWRAQDFESDGTHPSDPGEQQVGALLLTFFKTAPQAACWFVAGQVCP